VFGSQIAACFDTRPLVPREPLGLGGADSLESIGTRETGGNSSQERRVPLDEYGLIGGNPVFPFWTEHMFRVPSKKRTREITGVQTGHRAWGGVPLLLKTLVCTQHTGVSSACIKPGG
jgi:hypothetical protein